MMRYKKINCYLWLFAIGLQQLSLPEQLSLDNLEYARVGPTPMYYVYSYIIHLISQARCMWMYSVRFGCLFLVRQCSTIVHLQILASYSFDYHDNLTCVVWYSHFNTQYGRHVLATVYFTFIVDFRQQHTQQEENFHWNLIFAISLLANSLNLNST